MEAPGSLWDLPWGRAHTNERQAMTDFTEEQQAALATLTVEYPRGITLTDDRVHDIEVCDQLVSRGTQSGSRATASTAWGFSCRRSSPRHIGL